MFSDLLKSLRMGHRPVYLPSPLAGDIVPLADVQDETFSKGLLGEGVAVRPSLGRVVAPSICRIEAIFPTGHAVALHTVEGLDVLIHVGLDTVSLGGRFFKVNVRMGDTVNRGDVIIEFDREAILRQGLDLTVPILIRNSAEFASVRSREGSVRELERLIVARER